MVTAVDLNRNFPTTPTHEALNSKIPTEQDGPGAILTLEEYRRFVYAVPAFYLLLAPLGIATNVVNIYGFVKLGLTESVSLTMFFLSVSDFFLSFTQLINSFGPLFLALEESGLILLPVHPFVIVSFCGPMGINSYSATTLITTYLALTRCLCVVQPLRFKSMFTVRSTLPVLLSFLLFPQAIYILGYVGTGPVMGYDPQHNVSRIIIWVAKDRRARHDAVVFILNFFIPFSCQVLTFVSVVFLISGLRSTSAFRSSTTNTDDAESKENESLSKFKFWRKSQGSVSRNQAGIVKQSQGLSEKSKSRKHTELHGKELRVARQVILISVVFIVTNIPAILRSAGKLIIDEFSIGRAYHNFYQIASNAIVLLSLLNGCTTFAIYLKFNTAFKNVFFHKAC